jgi:hypothetical protein
MKSMNNNPLSDLDSMLKRAGHETWGWRIYRCTYNSDDDWTEFMKQLKNTFQQMLDDYGATDDQAKQQIWTVVEDRERLENATKSDVRRMFKDWVNSPEAAAEQPNARGPLSRVGMARYLYCMHVDEESLRSVLDDSDDWHVNIIERDWVSEERRVLTPRSRMTMKRSPMERKKQISGLKSKAAPRRTWVGRRLQKGS